jgi:hypothetical protein
MQAREFLNILNKIITYHSEGDFSLRALEFDLSVTYCKLRQDLRFLL